MNDISAGHPELPRTAYLDHTLRRARTAAEQRQHRYVTLEHLLLALLDDPDALAILRGVGADIVSIKINIADTVNTRMASLVVPGGQPPSFSYKFDTLFVAASEDAIRLGRAQVDGGLTIIAVAKERDAPASGILAAGGFHYAVALHSLGAPATPQRASPLPPPDNRDYVQLPRRAPEGENQRGPRPWPETPVAAKPSDIDPSRTVERPADEGEVPDTAPVETSDGAVLVKPDHPVDYGQEQPAPARPAKNEAFATRSAEPSPMAPPPAAPSPLPEAARRPLLPPVTGAALTSGESSMEDMLASVRNILEDEERKERGLGPTPAAPNYRELEKRFEPPREPSRAEPRLSLRVNARPPDPTPAPREPSFSPPQRDQARIEPIRAPELAPPPPNRAPPRPLALQEPPQSSYTLDVPAPAANRRRKGRDAAPNPVQRLFERIPQRMRIGALQTIDIRLSKEEAYTLFDRLARRSPAQQGLACRTVTMRLSAPEGGFFIENGAPETQWLFDRPSFLGEEAFGQWSWTVLPNDSGTFTLIFAVSFRDVDQNGIASGANLPVHTVKVRVNSSFLRTVGQALKMLFVLLAGSGLTVAVYYALKTLGKLPQ